MSYQKNIELTKLFSSSLKKVDREIFKRLDDNVPLLSRIGSHLITAKGKRIRPILTLAMAAQLNDFSRNPTLLAAAVEFIHTATLLHDDVVDESDYRRGIKTANVVWGNGACVLAGDFLFAQSFDLMVETKSIEALSVLAKASCKITQGEFLQMQISNNPDTKLDDYYKVIGGKTAELFGAACQSGTIIANGNKKQIKASYDYGYNIGIAFQIIDDVMDFTEEKKTTGKNIGDDFKSGKTTLPVILAWNESDKKEKDFWIRTLKMLNQKKSDLQKAKEIINKYKIISKCKEIASHSIKISLDALKTFPDNKYKSSLEKFAKDSLLRNN